MHSVPSHCTVETALPSAVADYFAPERATLDEYLDLVPESIDSAGDPSLGPVHALPWVYVADLTGWRGLALARLLAAERDCPCYRLSPLARDSVDTLWNVLDRSSEGPVVLHVELRGDTGPVPGTLREALWRGYDQPTGDDADAASGDPTNLHVVLTDTRPSKRLSSPLPDATAPVSGATLSYAPRESMTPEQPHGTTTLAAPPALSERTDRLEALLSAALDSVGTEAERTTFVDSAVEALVITHSTIGKQDLLFDVSPRIALKHGHRLDALGVDGALAALRDDLLAQVPQSPTTGELRRTLASLLDT